MKKTSRNLETSPCRQSRIILLGQFCLWRGIPGFSKSHNESLLPAEWYPLSGKKQQKPSLLAGCFTEVTVPHFTVPKIHRTIIIPFTELKMA